jgi:predicted ATPase
VQQGHKARAYALLKPTYAWFSEGFDTKDLQEAEALLTWLDQEAARDNSRAIPL